MNTHKIRLLAVLLMLLAGVSFAQRTSTVDIESDGLVYPAYLAEPRAPGSHPAVILLHSFRGLQEGYRTFTREFAAEGYVVLAIQWQTHASQPDDAVVEQLLRDGITFLEGKDNVNADRLGLTGFCAGGRYTMLMLPQIDDFSAGVAWYGFPYNGDPSAADLAGELDTPLYIIHGSADQPSPIGEIYDYAQALEQAGAYYELKVYAGQPHGFMVEGPEVNREPAAQNAYQEMVAFFDRFLQ